MIARVPSNKVYIDCELYFRIEIKKGEMGSWRVQDKDGAVLKIICLSEASFHLIQVSVSASTQMQIEHLQNIFCTGPC